MQTVYTLIRCRRLICFAYVLILDARHQWVKLIEQLNNTNCVVSWCRHNRMIIHEHIEVLFRPYMNINVIKHTFWDMRQIQNQMCLHIHAVHIYAACSESSLPAWGNFASLTIQNALSEDSDQTVQLHRLIRIFAGRTCPKIRFLTLRHTHTHTHPHTHIHTHKTCTILCQDFINTTLCSLYFTGYFQLAFFINLLRADIGPPATLTGR